MQFLRPEKEKKNTVSVWDLTVWTVCTVSKRIPDVTSYNIGRYIKPFHLVQRFSYMDVMTKILGWKFIMIFNCERKTWFGPIRSLITFIGQKISIFRHYLHVQKPPNKMRRFLVFRPSNGFVIKENVCVLSVYHWKKLITNIC